MQLGTGVCDACLGEEILFWSTEVAEKMDGITCCASLDRLLDIFPQKWKLVGKTSMSKVQAALLWINARKLSQRERDPTPVLAFSRMQFFQGMLHRDSHLLSSARPCLQGQHRSHYSTFVLLLLLLLLFLAINTHERSSKDFANRWTHDSFV